MVVMVTSRARSLHDPTQQDFINTCTLPIYETGYIETRIHSVRRRVFTPDSPKLISRKSLPKIFFHVSHQRKNKKSWMTFCNDETTTTTTIK